MAGKVIPPYERKGYKSKKLPVFCQNVQKRRLELGITQEQLANTIGTDRPRVSQIEAGRLPRDEDRIIAIAKALHVDINWLFGFTPEHGTEKSPPHTQE